MGSKGSKQSKLKQSKTQVESTNNSNNNYNRSNTFQNRPRANEIDYMAPPPINYQNQQNVTDNPNDFSNNGIPSNQNNNQINNNIDNNGIYDKPVSLSEQNQSQPQPLPQSQPQPQPQPQLQQNQIYQSNPQPQIPMGVASPYYQPVGNPPGMPVVNGAYPMPVYYGAPGYPYPYYAPQPGVNTVLVLPPGYKRDRGYSPWGDLAEDIRDLF